MAECAGSASDPPCQVNGIRQAAESAVSLSDMQGNSSGAALMVCTIASSVSTLAVSENSLPGLATTSDHDSACCPPKRKCLSVGDVHFEPLDSVMQSDSSPRPFCERDIAASVRVGTHCCGGGSKLGNTLNIVDTMSTSFSSQVKPECSYVDGIVSGGCDCAEFKPDMQGVESVELMERTVHKTRAGGHSMQRVQQLSCSDDTEGCGGTAPTFVSSRGQAARVTGHTLTPPPNRCQMFGSTCAGCGVDVKQWREQTAVGTNSRCGGSGVAGKQLKKQTAADGTESDGSCAGHGSRDSHVSGKVEVHASGPQWSVAKPGSSSSGAHAPGSVCCGGDAPRPGFSLTNGHAPKSAYSGNAAAPVSSPGLSTASAQVGFVADLSSELSSATSAAELKDETAESSLQTDFPQFTAATGLPQFVKTSLASSHSHGTKLLECQDFGAATPSCSQDCGTDVLHMSTGSSELTLSSGCEHKNAALTLSTDCEYENATLTLSTDYEYEYETDTSGCSESSSDATTSSSDSCNDQSVPNVSSARMSPQKQLQCSAPFDNDSNLKRLGKSRKTKKKAPSYGLKTDAVNALLGLRRSAGYPKTKQSLYMSQSREDRSRLLARVGEGGTDAAAAASKLLITINDLPCVLLVHILSFLPVATRIGRVSLVCKRWQSAVLDPCLWRRLDLRNLPRLKDAVLLQLASLSDRVYTLILSDGRSTLLTDHGVSKVLQQCSHLKKVKFNRCFFLSDDAFEHVGRCCHNLLCLNLSGCFTVTNTTLLAISEGCPQLQDLDVGQCAKITDEGVCAVAKGCPHLTRLRLDQCGKLTNSAVQTVADHCPKLQYLHLLSCTLTDAGISHLSKLRHLQVLNISNVSQLSPRVVEAVTACCPALETLAISLNRAVDDQCLRHIVSHCPKLKCLSCVACSLSDLGLHYIAQHGAHLERLDVAWCSDITDQGIIEISAACPKLRYLGIMRCGLITMATVEQLLQRHPSIQYSNFELDSRRLLGRAAEEGYRAASM